MTSDISYNYLNLPAQITFSNGNIQYIYDAAGVKLKKIVTENSNITIKDYAGNYVYENDQLQFFNHAEGYTTPDGSGGFDYVYQYLDHLGNVRISYSDSDGNGSVSAFEIIEESNYYPFGLKHEGYNSNISSNGNSVAQKFKYNGIELEESLGLNLYEMDVRSYDPAIGRFTSMDPVIHYEFSTYNAFDNNPIVFADPSGANADWIPEVDKQGNISYVAETGDSAKTLSDQFGIKQSDAEKITESTGSTKIDKGTKVTGEKVVSVVEGNDNGILKLNVGNKNTTDSDIVNQAVFAIRNENVQESLGNGGADGEDGSGNVDDYFTTNSIRSNDGVFYGFGTDPRKPVTFNLGGGESVLLSLSIGQSNNGRFNISIGDERQQLYSDGTYHRYLDYNSPRRENQATRGFKSIPGRNIRIHIHSDNGSGHGLRRHLDGN
ncbi:MAG: hypothetical protein KAH72_00550 [Flavobacteriaceae bacterium]|nr:hypothetical protein [Flavobacteriaceae bacterium]